MTRDARGRRLLTLLAYGRERFERYHKGRRWGHRMTQANLAAVRAASGRPEPTDLPEPDER